VEKRRLTSYKFWGPAGEGSGYRPECGAKNYWIVEPRVEGEMHRGGGLGGYRSYSKGNWKQCARKGQ